MGKFKDSDASFSFKESKSANDSAGTQRKDRYDNYSGGKHDHTWSATPQSGDGRHREGWIGRSVGRSRDSDSGK